MALMELTSFKLRVVLLPDAMVCLLPRSVRVAPTLILILEFKFDEAAPLRNTPRMSP